MCILHIIRERVLSKTDVLIAGAGAAGLTLAIELARRNVAFRLIDKLESPFMGSRGKGIQPRSLEIFEDLGIVDRLAAIGGPYPPMREYLSDGSFRDSNAVENAGPTPAEPYRAPLMVPQFLTEAAMRARLAEFGGRVEYGIELAGFEQDGDGVTARCKSAGSEEIVHTRYLAGTDGGRSFVRRALDIGFPGQTLPLRAMFADVTLRGLSRDFWHRFNPGTMDAQISLCPLAGTDMFQLQAPVPLEGDIDLSAGGLNAMVATRTGRSDIVIGDVSWVSVFGMNARLADRYRVNRAFIAGDAAHVHPPTGGQGLNTSMQDTYNLGWKLAAVLAGASDSLLDTYEEERRPVAAGMLGLSTRLLDAAKEGSMRRGREVHQLDIGYPGSSLAMESPEPVSGIRAGDRAPDALLEGAAGQPIRLFRLFEGPHWTLIGHEAHGAAVPRAGLRSHTIGKAGDLRDHAGHFRTAYGLDAGDWLLVRPDGYVGARVSALEPLEDYLDEMGLERAL